MSKNHRKEPAKGASENGPDGVPEVDPRGASSDTDLSHFRLSQNFADGLVINTVQSPLAVRKPNRQEWFQVRPGEAGFMDAYVLHLVEEDERYLLTPAVAAALGDDARPTRLYVTANRSGAVFLWPVFLPGADGRLHSFPQSAHQAAAKAATGLWYRLVANRSAGAYELHELRVDVACPEWPDSSVEELVKRAFEGRLIEDARHELVLRLQGLA